MNLDQSGKQSNFANNMAAYDWVDQRGFLTNVYFSVTSKANPIGTGNNKVVTMFSKPILYPKGQYEVALVNLGLSPLARGERQPEVQPQAEVVEQVMETSEQYVAPSDPLFPDMTPSTVTDFRIIKEDQQLMKFMASIARKLLPLGFTLEYRIVSKQGGPAKLHVAILHANEDPGKFLRLPRDLATLMGFKRTDFYPGASLPEDEMFDSLYQNVPVGHEYKIEFVTPTYTQNVIQVGVRRRLTYPEFIVKRKTWQEFFPWLTTRLLEMGGLRIEFSFNEHNVCTMEIHSMLDDDGDDFSLPVKLMNVLGFEENTFKVGIFTAKQPINFEEFNKIELDDDLWFIARDMVPMKVFMTEPKNLELDSVIQTVNSALLAVEYSEPITFFYYKGTLGFKIENDDVTVTLPDVVNSYFGFPENKLFKSGMRVPLKSELVQQEDTEAEAKEGGTIAPTPSQDVQPIQVLVLSPLFQTNTMKISNYLC